MFLPDASGASGTFALPLLRLRTNVSVELTIQSTEPVWIATHYLKRQLPCAGPDCPLCVEMAPRTKGFFIATLADGSHQRAMLVEVSPNAMSGLQGLQLMSESNFAPGQKIVAFKRRANSPLRLEPKEEEGTIVEDLRSEFRLLCAVGVIFGIPLPSPGETVTEWDARIHDGLLRKLRRASA